MSTIDRTLQNEKRKALFWSIIMTGLIIMTFYVSLLELGPFVTHNEDSNQLYSSFMERKKENSNIKAESGETSKRFLYREGKMFHFGSGRRDRTFKAPVNVIGSV